MLDHRSCSSSLVLYLELEYQYVSEPRGYVLPGLFLGKKMI